MSQFGNLGVDRAALSQQQSDLTGAHLPATDHAREVVEILREHPLVQEALGRLQKELPQGLAYHNYQHTEDVLYNVVKLGLADGLGEDDLTLLAIAAAWHDTGFIRQTQKNEPIAAQFVREAMTNRHFSEADIRDVETAILDTQIKYNPALRTLEQHPTGRLSPWLLDADLSNFGGNDFMTKSVQVYAELSGKTVTGPAEMKDDAGKAYVTSTVRMLAWHDWHSAAGRNLFEAQEQINLQRLGVLLAELVDGTDTALQNAWNKLMGR